MQQILSSNDLVTLNEDEDLLKGCEIEWESST